jgi:hypothetical protein
MILHTNPFCTFEMALSGTVLHFENQWFLVLEKHLTLPSDLLCLIGLLLQAQNLPSDIGIRGI